MRLVVEPMVLEDIPQVLEVDRESYSLPWPASAYRREVLHNRNARYFVLRGLRDGEDLEEDRQARQERARSPLPFLRWPRPSADRPPPSTVVGYAGMWMMVDEAHITTIAIRTSWRGRGLGEVLLSTLVEQAIDLGAERVTLEVRVSNETAQNLYRKYGFELTGRRNRYYSDNNEDAFIMTTVNIRNQPYQTSFQSLVHALQRRLSADPEVEVTAPSFGIPVENDLGLDGG